MNNATENKKVSSREVFTDGKDGQRDQPNLTTRKQKGFLAGGFHRWQRRTARPAEPDHEKTKKKNQNTDSATSR
jgi:hypothetical protein